MKTSIERNYSKIRFNSSVEVANCHTTRYYATAVWHIRRNNKGEYIAYSTGVSKGRYPYIGGLGQDYLGMRCAAIKMTETRVREILKDAQTGKGYWSENHGAYLVD